MFDSKVRSGKEATVGQLFASPGRHESCEVFRKIDGDLAMHVATFWYQSHRDDDPWALAALFIKAREEVDHA